MVLGFVLFWPVGLAILAYLIWSGRMGCGQRSGWSSRWERKMQKFQDKMDRWGVPPEMRERARSYAGGFGSSGNRAFDEYREATMKRLEEEFGEFKSFLDKLREAKDRQEFEQFMNDRRNRSADSSKPDTGGGSFMPPSGSQQFRP